MCWTFKLLQFELEKQQRLGRIRETILIYQNRSQCIYHQLESMSRYSVQLPFCLPHQLGNLLQRAYVHIASEKCCANENSFCQCIVESVNCINMHFVERIFSLAVFILLWRNSNRFGIPKCQIVWSICKQMSALVNARITVYLAKPFNN